MHWPLGPVHKTIASFITLCQIIFSERPLYMTWQVITIEATSQDVRKLSFVGTSQNVTRCGILCEKGRNFLF